MDLGLAGRTAVVAASSKGLGGAVAEEFAEEGANVVMCARGAEELAAAAESVRARGSGEVLAQVADLSELGAGEEVVRRAIERFGTVDILVNNAGGPPAGRFEDHTPEAWRAAVRLNLESALEMTRAALPAMKEGRWGRVINITSVSVKEPVDNLILSNSVRAAVTGWAKTLSNEVAADGVTVNNVLPGFTRTQRMEQLASATAERTGATASSVMEQWEKVIPAGRMGEPREFAAVVAFVASERASYLNGLSIAVDGGRTRALY
ncbi:MAG: SDR family oxidoreductase [Gemmatimonadetes bacterium]|nr:SDR family oxidoreductase [Gemmatimonadota bacterium]